MFIKRFLSRAIPAVSLSFALLTAAPAAHATVKVGLSDWPGWVAWYVAEQKGFFKKYGADVKLVWFANYTDSISALSAGQIDANSQTWSDTMAPLAKGIALKTIMVNDNSAGNDALMVSPKIKSMADLKGKSVALEEFSVSHFLLTMALSKNGMSLKDVKVVNLSAGDAAAAFLAGRVDAAVVWNPWVNKIQTSGKGKPLFTSKEVPGMIPDLLVAQEKSVKANRKDYLGMIKAWYDTEKFIRENPDEATRIMAKVVSMPPAEYKIFLPGTKFFDQKGNLQAFGPASDATSLMGVAPTIAKFLLDNKLMEGKVDFAKGLDSSLVQEVAKR
ncbi:sulfonate ABC transporter substrate-binding protein [Sulfurimicrobium lacus]|uniref:Sulfonate ABC transporter substrate-binding protein n=1 Tax=Sulfurimicrobium lacus TaxID=2715678 RepID=A0A6F8V8E5_9PROT|nr:ABC transporter substrate-binding protein [Sulfurimicrobium lacus]BCB25276.1 sulfonate ABC transporter substrate-binding protein [Sulfurimicrobium lacus]